MHAVDVAERRGQQVASVFAGPERRGDAHQVVGGGVERVVVAVRAHHVVLLAADDAAFDLEHDPERSELPLTDGRA
jgi:hypothetical protein